MDFVYLEKPYNPQEGNVEVADGAMPTDGAFVITIDLSILAIAILIYGHTHMIRVPQICLEARRF